MGVDEAGRGALAGPVVAAMVFLPRNLLLSDAFRDDVAGINDSKTLSAASRDKRYATITAWTTQGALWRASQGSVAEIAEHNILGATKLAMFRAIGDLAFELCAATQPQAQTTLPLGESCHLPRVRLLIDGKPLRGFAHAHEGITKGDGKSLAIAAASILAKVSRDRHMMRLDQAFPQYGFARHKGYATRVHREAIVKHGACPEHRQLFLRKCLG